MPLLIGCGLFFAHSSTSVLSPPCWLFCWEVLGSPSPGMAEGPGGSGTRTSDVQQLPEQHLTWLRQNVIYLKRGDFFFLIIWTQFFFEGFIIPSKPGIKPLCNPLIWGCHLHVCMCPVCARPGTDTDGRSPNSLIRNFSL